MSVSVSAVHVCHGSKVTTTEVMRAESLCDEVESGSVCDTQIMPKIYDEYK